MLGSAKIFREKKSPLWAIIYILIYRDRLKDMYVVARNFFLHLLNFSAWPCLAVA